MLSHAYCYFLCLQSLILSTAVPTIIGFSLWREVRFSAPYLSVLYVRLLQSHHLLSYWLLSLVFPSCLGGAVWSAGVLRRRYSRAGQLDQVRHQILKKLLKMYLFLCVLCSVCHLSLTHCFFTNIQYFKFLFWHHMSSSSSSRSQAPVAAVFAGSPQMLGTVKLCSGSAVTSLPLYSDISLLRRTEDVSDCYSENEIHLKKQIHYIIWKKNKHLGLAVSENTSWYSMTSLKEVLALK